MLPMTRENELTIPDFRFAMEPAPVITCKPKRERLFTEQDIG